MLEIGIASSKKPKVWTPETIQQLRQLWDDGLSAAQIANEIPGSTRNGCIGKAHRMGLPGRKQAPSLNPGRIRDKRERKRTMPEFKPPLPLPPPEAPKGDLVPFMKARATTCRSIEGQGEDGLAMFCPNSKTLEQSFCAYHQNIYYRKVER